LSQTLVFTHGPLAGKRLSIKRDEITLGRRSTNDIVLNDPMVSRLHAIVVRRSGSLLVEDLGSHNGTYVNGERVMFLRQLQHGDLLQIGASRALYEDASVHTDETTKVDHLGGPTQAFTQRQLQVLRLAARGLPNKDIATRLYVSPRTVKAYLSSVFDKLGVSNRAGAITTALRLGLIDLPSGREEDAGEDLGREDEE
jgi:pSer/pThr/pTyr-binding forkhead associated (FHA) protein